VPPQPQTLRRRRLLALGVLLVVLSALVYLPVTLLAPLAVVSADAEEWQAPEAEPLSIAWPDAAAAAVGAVGYDGVLASTGSGDALPMASITKIVTSLVVLEKHPLADGEDGPLISFDDTDVARFTELRDAGGAVAPVSAGLSLPLRAVLEVVLIESANNYTESLVDWAFADDDAAFAAAADAWLDEHGLTDTTVVEPTGLSYDNRSTTADLVELARIALADPLIHRITSTVAMDIPGVGLVENSNTLLGRAGVTGIKTGTLRAAGANLLFSADYPVGSHTVTVLGVVLGSTDHVVLNRELETTLTGVAAGFREVELTSKGEPFASYETEWGDTADAVAAESASTLLWADETVVGEVEPAAVEVGDTEADAGGIRFTVDGEVVAEVPLVLDDPLEHPDAWWRLTHPRELLAPA
jgi:D-alanyl-D-alanine carboxypeptidase (penicillin-binding protein 5/6)